MEQNPSLKYRADIDGLRALAVLAVVFFHGGSSIFSGGFVGVDIFFVISGFLITKIINKEIEKGSFSYRRFWLKRIRRIFPASFVCVTVSALFFAFILSPSDYSTFGKSLFSLGLFASNLFFWRESGYFSQNAEEFPLLHTWSLTIEEQFYFFLPFTLILIHRFFPKRKILLFSGLTLLSFLLCLYFTGKKPAASFYLLPTRAWELGVGALLAFIPDQGKRQLSSYAKHFLVALSLALMLGPIFFFDKTTPFPGYFAGIPTIGAALFIFLPSENSGLKKVFHHPLILMVGKISYSLYLWHWVVFVALKHLSLTHPTGAEFFIAGIFSMLLAGLSYLFVEEPVRRGHQFWTNQKMWSLLAINSVVFLGLGLVAVTTKGIPARFGSSFVDYKKVTKIAQVKDYCPQKEGVVCLSNQGQETNSIFLWGDSHGQSLLPVFSELAKERKLNFYFSIHEGCPPLFNTFLSSKTLAWNQKCQEYREKTIQFLRNFKGIVFLAFRYDIYFNERRAYEKAFMKERYLTSELGLKQSKQESLKQLYAGLKATQKELIDKEVTLIRQVPAFAYHPAITLNKEQLLGKKVNYQEKRENLETRVHLFEKELAKTGIKLLNTWEPFCSEKYCSPLNGHDKVKMSLYYYDDDHLSVEGSKRIKDLLIRSL